MTTVLRLLDKLPLHIALILGLVLGFSPFVPEPHVVEKLRMLGQGTLAAPLDIFDLIYHALPLALLIAKLARVVWLKRKQP